MIKTMINDQLTSSRVAPFTIFNLLLSLLVGCGGSSSSADTSGALDWPLFRCDAALSGYTDTRLPKNPVLMWTYKSEARTASSPVAADGVTYWSDKRGHIRGVDLTGVQVFDYDLKTAVEATPMIHYSTLYIGRIDGIISAISLSRKDTLWNCETMGQISASPNYVNFEDHPAIVVGSYDNYLYCLDSKTGREISRFESGYYINGAVALWKQYVIFGGCDSWLRVIDCQTGISTDSLLLDAYIPASPAIIDNFCYIGDYSENIYEIQLEKGKIVRYQKIMEATDSDGFVSVPAIAGKNLYFLSYDKHLYSVNRKDGSINWKYLLKGNVGESSPVVCRDRIIVCTKTGIVSILNAEKGTLEWEYDTGEQIIASPAVIKNRFLILTAKGTLFCFGENI